MNGQIFAITAGNGFAMAVDADLVYALRGNVGMVARLSTTPIIAPILCGCIPSRDKMALGSPSHCYRGTGVLSSYPVSPHPLQLKLRTWEWCGQHHQYGRNPKASMINLSYPVQHPHSSVVACFYAFTQMMVNRLRRGQAHLGYAWHYHLQSV